METRPPPPRPQLRPPPRPPLRPPPRHLPRQPHGEPDARVDVTAPGTTQRELTPLERHTWKGGSNDYLRRQSKLVDDFKGLLIYRKDLLFWFGKDCIHLYDRGLKLMLFFEKEHRYFILCVFTLYRSIPDQLHMYMYLHVQKMFKSSILNVSCWNMESILYMN